jgi:hypothetical protein
MTWNPLLERWSSTNGTKVIHLANIDAPMILLDGEQYDRNPNYDIEGSA